MTALRMAEVILFVVQLELSSLRNAVRILAMLDADAALNNKVRVVLNRVGSDSDISIEHAEKTIGKPIYWQLPNDPGAVTEAYNQGMPLLQSAPRSKIQQAVAGLALALTGKQTPPPSKGKISRWGLFSRK